MRLVFGTEREKEKKNIRVCASNNKWPPWRERERERGEFRVRDPPKLIFMFVSGERSIVSVFLNEGILFQSLADRNRANHCDYATTLVHGTSLEAHVPKWPRPRGFVVTNTRGWRGGEGGIKGLKTVVTDPLVRTQPAYRGGGRGRGRVFAARNTYLSWASKRASSPRVPRERDRLRRCN